MQRRRVFTLIELLIVVAIIAILAGMLLPALNSVREKAKTSLCLSRMKQLGLGRIQYFDSSDGYIPEHTTSASRKWAGVMFEGGYVATAKLFFCPSRGANTSKTAILSNENSFRKSPTAYQWAYVDYGMNSETTGVVPTSRRIYKINQIKNASRMFDLVETVDSCNDPSVGNYIASETYVASGTQRILWPVHSNLSVCNTLFFDGHAESTKNSNRGLAWSAYEYSAVGHFKTYNVDGNRWTRDGRAW